MMRTTAFLALLLGSLAACGSLGDESEKSTLAVLSGQLTTNEATAGDALANVRVAIVWNTTGAFRTTYDVAVTPVFPSKFRIEITEPPPVIAMQDSSDEEVAPTEDNTNRQSLRPNANATTYAIGTLIAYEDKNGNGKLDLNGPDEPTVDRVLGTNSRLSIQYFEGAPPARRGVEGAPVRGYNIFRSTACTIDEPCTEKAGWLPITTPYELPLSADPSLAEAICSANGGSSDAYPTTFNVEPGETPPPAPGTDGWPAKGARGLECAADNQSYAITKCWSKSKGLCKGTAEGCSKNTYRPPSTTPPPEWPCPN